MMEIQVGDIIRMLDGGADEVDAISTVLLEVQSEFGRKEVRE